MLFKSIAAALSAVAFLAPLAQGQATGCLNGTLEGTTANGRYTGSFFELVTLGDSWLVEVSDLTNPAQIMADSALNCNPTVPQVDPSGEWGVNQIFHIPQESVGIMDTYAMTYIEMLGKRTTIKKIQDPEKVVSPCIQKMLATGLSTTLSDMPNDAEAEGLGMIITTQTQGVPKAFKVQHTDDADPLQRAEMIKLYSLLYNMPAEGDRVYKQIEQSFNNIKSSLANIPETQKKRVAWIFYDYKASHWNIRTTSFAMKMIQAAGGIAMGNEGDLNTNTPQSVQVSVEDIQFMLNNAQVVIDDTEFPADLKGTQLDEWRRLAGFQSNQLPKIIEKRQLYTVDREVNGNGTSSYKYRVAARPDLLLMDIVMAQYPNFDLTYKLEFLRVFATTDGPPKVYTADDCQDPAQITARDTVTIQPLRPFAGDGTTPPAVDGCSTYFDASCDDRGGKGKISTGAIVAVVIVALVMAGGFAFVLFKWKRRTKEDAFIELEDEMERDIPLRW